MILAQGMVRPEVLTLIVLCALVTVLPRVLPLMLIGKISLPPLAIAWLRHIPIAVITALLCQDLLAEGLHWYNDRLLAGILTLAVAFITRSLLGTVILGVAIYLLFLLL